MGCMFKYIYLVVSKQKQKQKDSWHIALFNWNQLKHIATISIKMSLQPTYCANELILNHCFVVFNIYPYCIDGKDPKYPSYNDKNKKTLH